MLAQTDWVPVLTAAGAFVVILSGAVIAIMKQLADMKTKVAEASLKMEETKKAVDGSLTLWKSERKEAEAEMLKWVELAARTAGAKEAQDIAHNTAAQVREAAEEARRERAETAKLAKPDASAGDSGVPLQDLRVVENPDEETK